MKNEQRIYKNKFGSFCSQFGFSQKETKPPFKQCKKRQVGRNPSKKKFYHNKRGTHGINLSQKKYHIWLWYETAFVIPFRHYEWNVMPFGLKNAPLEFQNIMNEIFNQFSDFIIVYIDNVLVYSISIKEHWKHLNKFIQTVKSNGLSLSATKINLFQTKIRFIGHHIY